MPATMKIGVLLCTATMAGVLSTVAWAQQCAHSGEETARERERRVLALSVARLINTVEVNHKKQFGEFLPLADLPRSPIIEEINKEGSLYGAYKKMSFAPDSDSIPGFELRLTLSGEGYAFSLRDKSDPCRFSYFSDERGVIYEGIVIGSPPALTK